MCGGYSAGYTGVHHARRFAVLPMLARPRELVAFHRAHALLGTDSGSGIGS